MLLTRPSTLKGKQRIFPPPSINWDATNPTQAFHKFSALAYFLPKDNDVNERDQYHKMDYLLAHKDIEDWKSFNRE